jgi:thiol-disulfide isomerase/thioredoxin
MWKLLRIIGAVLALGGMPAWGLLVANAEGGAAPEFVGIDQWLNSGPLTIAGLRGKVVLVDFWTYGCINCVRTLPHVTRLYDMYKTKGLVVVGIHTPEFPFEKSTANLQAAIQRHGIRYPVAQDNAFATWNAYRNQYWPAQYVVDRSGRIVFAHAGEGQYDEIERKIRALLDAGS